MNEHLGYGLGERASPTNSIFKLSRMSCFGFCFCAFINEIIDKYSANVWHGWSSLVRASWSREVPSCFSLHIGQLKAFCQIEERAQTRPPFDLQSAHLKVDCCICIFSPNKQNKDYDLLEFIEQCKAAAIFEINVYRDKARLVFIARFKLACPDGVMKNTVDIGCCYCYPFIHCEHCSIASKAAPLP